MVLALIILAVVILLSLMLLLVPSLIYFRNRRQADLSWSGYAPQRLTNLESVRTLTILPLIDWYANRESLLGEPGVSWLVQADGTKILVDVGLNMGKENPSPLLRNMQKLNVNLQDVNYIFITHLHMDHCGGWAAQRDRTFKPSGEEIDLSHVTAFVPTAMRHTSAKIKLIEGEQVLMPGIASEGPIDRSIYGTGLIKEQALVVNVAGKGLVLIVGCGHQGLARILERAERVFEEPIYGLVGGLHYPVTASRMKLLRLPVQKFIGTGKPPWRKVTRDEVRESIAVLKKKQLKLVSISAHDSCDWTLDEFRKAFPEAYRELKVGLPLVV
jgi:7,8-dihydropterin-6-yl-methyl-4-(beta-D-ribofuranosyl)aminobenzene 5'-phosphate synthase